MLAWVLVFHLIGLVFWLGSLLVVTHILAFHTEEASMEARAALGRLEMKLFKSLTHPGAALMVITGAILIGANPLYLREHWLHAKLLLVAVLIVLDLRVYVRTAAFQAGRVELRRRECMALHGAISLVFFGILILVLLKPFGGGGSPRLRTGSLNSRQSVSVRKFTSDRPFPGERHSVCRVGPLLAACDRTLRVTSAGGPQAHPHSVESHVIPAKAGTHWSLA